MNLFYVHEDPKKAAQSLCDKHVVKMILETAQMLSTAHRLSDTSQAPFVYKMTHKNHPSTKWLRSSQIAYKWGLDHLQELFTEYTHRYGKIHKTEREKLE
ncbi:pyrimidine dimer DNA glycosylase/endonuclease V, partial [Planktomarina sp.]|uniref:pyrimidine dimer DNA glycosylase/endonuclease V n=1 Tax=Planktomarina sp. TaxID=2024851 RepID=UPI00326031F6